MIKVSKGTIKLWSRLGARATYGQAILEMAKEREDFLVLSADLAQSSGLGRFVEQYPDRFVNVGIAEQNMMGVAAGLAKDGTCAFASSFAPFVTMRACEQVRMNMGYMQLNIKAVGLGSGLVMAQLGNSHYGIEDASVMRAIPGMTVIEPADGLEIMKAVEALCDYDKPAYLRLTGGSPLPIVHQEDIDFEIGKAISLKNGSDVAIIATGSMVYYASEAANILEEQGISSSVIDMHTIKPLDADCVRNQLGKRLIVTVEEATVIGGLGSAVAECLATEVKKPPQIMFGIQDDFPHAGSYSYLLDKCGLTGEKIADSIIVALARLER